MTRRRCQTPLRVCFGVLVVTIGLLVGPASAADARKGTAASKAAKPVVSLEKPFFVVNVAGVNRLLADIDFIGGTFQKPGWAQSIRAVLALAGELKGIDRARPFGVMAFINPGVAPEPVAVGYLPIVSIKLLRQTLNLIASIQLSAAADAQGLYTLTYQGTTFFVKVQNGYAFIGRKPTSLNRRFGDPAKRFAAITRDYDMAIRHNLSAVPRGMKTMILDYLRAAAAAKSGQRSGESRQQHRLRTALVDMTLESLTRIAHDGERLTLGWRISDRQKQAAAAFDVRFEARPNTAMARRIADLSTTTRTFSGDQKARPPVSFSTSWKAAPCERRVLACLLDLAEHRLRGDGAHEQQGTKQLAAAIPKIRQIVESGHLTGMFSVFGSSRGDCLLAVAVKIAEGKQLDTDVTSFLTSLQRESYIRDLKLRAAQSGGISWNQFRAAGVSRFAAEILGSQTPAMIAGVDKRSLWLATGTDADPIALRKRFTKLNPQRSATTANTPVMRLSVRMSELLPILARGPKAKTVAALALKSFHKDDDNLLVLVSSESRTLSLRCRFGVGYLRLIGELLNR